MVKMSKGLLRFARNDSKDNQISKSNETRNAEQVTNNK